MPTSTSTAYHPPPYGHAHGDRRIQQSCSPQPPNDHPLVSPAPPLLARGGMYMASCASRDPAKLHETSWGAGTQPGVWGSIDRGIWGMCRGERIVGREHVMGAHGRTYTSLLHTYYIHSSSTPGVLPCRERRIGMWSVWIQGRQGLEGAL